MGNWQGPRLQISEETIYNAGKSKIVYRGKLESVSVVVKKIAKDGVNFEGLKQQFDPLTKVVHPHVVKFLGLFDDDQSQENRFSLVMEEMNQALTKFLKKEKGQLSPEKQVDLSHQIASGLHCLHHQSPPVLHRNLKPSNILLDEDCKVAKISDFWQSRLAFPDTRHMPTESSKPYLPPECLRDEDLQFDAKGDVFSLGVVMLEIATQLRPSCGLEGIGVVAEVERRAEDLSKIPDNHPLKSLIKECLKDNPEERPTVEEVVLKLLQHPCFHHPGCHRLYTELKRKEQIFENGALVEDNQPTLKSFLLPQLPIKGCSATAVVNGEKIYVCGGASPDLLQARFVQVYNTLTATWSMLPPSPLHDSQAALVNGKLTLFAGRDASTEKITNLTSTWDEEKLEWISEIPPLPTARARPCVISCDDFILVAGGKAKDNKTLLDSIDVLNTSGNQPKWTTSRLGRLPVKTWDATASIGGDYVYLTSVMETLSTGVRHTYQISKEDLLRGVRDEERARWTRIADTPYWESGLVENCKLPVVVGGCDKDEEPVSNISIYNPTTDKWTNVGECRNLYSCAVATSACSFVVIGGYENPKDIWSSLSRKFELFTYERRDQEQP